MLPGRLLGVDWSEQIGERLTGRDASCPFIELLVGELSTCPPIQEWLRDARIKTLNANRGERILSRLDTRGHAPILDPTTVRNAHGRFVAPLSPQLAIEHIRRAFGGSIRQRRADSGDSRGIAAGGGP